MELADDSGMSFNAGSAKACFTMAWQSSNLPSIATVRTLSLSVVISLRWLSLTSAAGKSTMTRTPGILWNACATAAPVSPLVAVRIVTCRPSSWRNRPNIRAIIWAAKSLNDAVGPWSRRIKNTRTFTISRGTGKL